LNDPGLALYTDDNGAFVFPNLNAGTYYIEATSDPKLYDPATEQINLLRGMTSINVTIYLSEKKQKGGNSASANVVSLSEVDPNVPAAAKKEYQQGSNLANQGHIEEAVERFKKAISLYPEYLVARNDLGVQYLKLLKWDKAAETFDALVKLKPKDSAAQLNLGIALFNEKKMDEAETHLREALKLSPNGPTAHYYLGLTMVSLKRYPEAQKELELAISNGGENLALAHKYLGGLYMSAHRNKEAADQLEKYLQLEPKSPDAEKIRGTIKDLRN